MNDPSAILKRQKKQKAPHSHNPKIKKLKGLMKQNKNKQSNKSLGKMRGKVGRWEERIGVG